MLPTISSCSEDEQSEDEDLPAISCSEDNQDGIEGRGIVAKWVEDRGFGFITPDTDTTDSFCSDLFVHCYDINGFNDGFKTLEEGHRVTFVKRYDAKRGNYRAVDVSICNFSLQPTTVMKQIACWDLPSGITPSLLRDVFKDYGPGLSGIALCSITGRW